MSWHFCVKAHLPRLGPKGFSLNIVGRAIKPDLLAFENIIVGSARKFNEFKTLRALAFQAAPFGLPLPAYTSSWAVMQCDDALLGC